MKFISARSQLGAEVQYTAKRAPVIFEARSRSRTPNSSPSSQCGLGAKSNAAAYPSAAPRRVRLAVPDGTLSSGRLGMLSRMSRSRASASSAIFSASAIFSRSSLVWLICAVASCFSS